MPKKPNQYRIQLPDKSNMGLLQNVASAALSRQKLAKNRSLHVVKYAFLQKAYDFEPIFNEEKASAVVLQQSQYVAQALAIIIRLR